MCAIRAIFSLFQFCMKRMGDVKYANHCHQNRAQYENQVPDKILY